MRRTRRTLIAGVCLLALLASGAGALAQKQAQERVPPPPDGRGTRVMVTTGPTDGNVVFSRSGDGYSFVVGGPELNFDGQVVKGAPYSGEAVTETVQTLADGNRIVRKSSARVYRDGEGRTRREQTAANVGPFATAGDAPAVVFINDPVAGVGYTLDARTHMARKTTGFAFGFGPPGEGPGGPLPLKHPGPPEPGAPPPPPPDGETRLGPGGVRPTAPPPPVGGPANAVKRVQPSYPPIAKAAGAEGVVAVQIVVDEQGNVASARAVSGHPLLRDASVDAARQWVFKPTVVGGKPAKVSGVITFSFVLDNKEEAGGPPPPLEPRFPKHEPVKESLGRQTVEGVEAEGTRETLTIPAGEIGNERAINIVTERWYAPELQVVVMSRHSDPRFGETTYRLTDINRAEPARTLFEVPADYTVKEPEQGRREFRLRREP